MNKKMTGQVEALQSQIGELQRDIADLMDTITSARKLVEKAFSWDAIQPPPPGFSLSPSEYAELIGLTPSAIRARIKSSKWKKGVHYVDVRAPGATRPRFLINPKAVEAGSDAA